MRTCLLSQATPRIPSFQNSISATRDRLFCRLTKIQQTRPPCTSPLSTSTCTSWPLKDLRSVSQNTSPLIFHLTSDDPHYNLSVEHYILTNSDPTSRILLFYTNRPCVVIGRNQNPWLETDISRLRKPAHNNPTSQPTELIRRRSGGGTVFHDDGNLNYSVIVPNTSQSFTRALHAEMVVRALHPLSTLYGFSDLKVNDRNDIVMRSPDPANNHWLKVSGSAYKLTRGRALHHGTLLFSSPNLHRISDILRSRGRGHIQAKGVESVRSKVGNLAWTADLAERLRVRQAVTEAITAEFWNVYGGQDQMRTPGENELTISENESDLVAGVPGLGSGIAELRTREWTFDQTPRFDYSSGMVEGVEVRFHVNHGMLEHVVVRFDDGRRDLEMDKDEIQNRDHGGLLSEGKLWSVSDWQGFLTGLFRDRDSGLVVPPSLVERIAGIFPGQR